MNEKTRFIEIISIIKNSGIVKDFTPEKLKNTIMKLGPTFIKIGQILSNRYDLLPKEYCDALSGLRANVEPMPYKDVKQILEEEYYNISEVFESISKSPIGSASIAQVHRAKLISGEDVVIKVQRKNIDTIMATDVKLLKKAIKYFHLNLIVRTVNLNHILDEIYNVAKEEMDFEIEARNIEEYKQNNEKIQYVAVPKVFHDLVTKKVLVMEYIDGIKLNNIKKLNEEGYDIEEIALKISNNFIEQALDDGFFHADLHPDNICIRNGKIVLFDLGMMGRLSNRNRNILKNTMKAIVRDDVSEVEKALIEISTQDKQVDHSSLRADIQVILDKNATEDIKNIKISDFVISVNRILKKYKIRLDKNITLLMRGICVIEGTLETIYPDINLMVVLENKVKEDSFRQLFSKDQVVKTGRNIINSANSITEIPTEMLNLLRDVNRGNTKIDIEVANSHKQVNKLEKMLHQLIIGLLDAATILGACMINNKILRYIYLIFAVIFTVWLFIQMARDHFHDGY